MSGGGTAGGRISAGVGANLISQHAQDRNQEATVYVGNLDVQVCSSIKLKIQELLHVYDEVAGYLKESK